METRHAIFRVVTARFRRLSRWPNGSVRKDRRYRIPFQPFSTVATNFKLRLLEVNLQLSKVGIVAKLPFQTARERTSHNFDPISLGSHLSLFTCACHIFASFHDLEETCTICTPLRYDLSILEQHKKACRGWRLRKARKQPAIRTSRWTQYGVHEIT